MIELLSTSDSRTPSRILLFGLYELGFRSLEALVRRDRDVIGVVTKPDVSLEAQPMIRLARTIGTPVFAPESPKDAAFLRQVRALRPDLIAVAGYHKILPPGLLRLPPRGVINLHGSLLPQYRGPCPWKWAIMNGETKSGATVQFMTSELDCGDILGQCEVPIDPQDTAESLFLNLCAAAGPLLARTIDDLEAGRAQPRKQDERRASYYGYPSDEDARIHWEWSAERIRNRVRGLCPRPGAWTQYGGKRVRVRKAALAEGPLSRTPGMILGRSEDALIVSTGQGNLSIGAMTIDSDDAAALPQSLWTVGLIPGTFFDPVPARAPHLKVT